MAQVDEQVFVQGHSACLLRSLRDSMPVSRTVTSSARHSPMNKQVLDSESVRESIKEILLGKGKLYGDLRIGDNRV